MKTVVYTAIFGNYDFLIPNKTAHAHHVCFTDANVNSRGWDIRIVERKHKDPRREARMYKALPHRWFPNTDTTIWHDGDIGLKVLPDEVACFLDGHDMAAFKHPWHKDIREEAKAIVTAGRGSIDAVYGQLAAYLKEGYAGPMFATGVLVRRNTDTIATFNEAWWTEMLHYTLRDQLSFPYCLWKMDMKCGIIPANLWPGLAPDMFWRSEHREEMFRAK